MTAQNNPLLGAWTLVSFEFRTEDGEIIYPYGKDAKGSIMYDPSGRYSAQLMRNDRPQFAASDQLKGTTEEIVAAYKGSISYFGSYEMDYENKIVTHHVESSIFPNMDGTSQRREYAITPGHLQLSTQAYNLNNKRGFAVLLWKKAG